MTIRVLLVDDSALTRAAFRTLLAKAGIDVAGEASGVSEAMERIERDAPHVILIDVTLQVLQAVRAVHAIRERHPQVGVVMLSSHFGDQALLRPLHCCADVLLSKKHACETQFIEAIRAVHASRDHPSGEARDVERLAPLPWCGLSAWERLSSREREVFKLVVEGKSSSEIAQLVKLSPKTVQTYRARIMSKLKVRGFSGLIKLALQYGLTSFG